VTEAPRRANRRPPFAALDVLSDFGSMGLELTRPVQARRESGVGSSSRIQYTPSAIFTRISSGIDPVWTSRDRPPEPRSRRRSKLGLREDGTMRRSFSRSEAPWGLRVDRPPRSRFSNKQGGRPIRESVPMGRKVFDSSPPKNLRPRFDGYSGAERRDLLAPEVCLLPSTEFGSLLSARGWLRL
jgi:hypothetical protein